MKSRITVFTIYFSLFFIGMGMGGYMMKDNVKSQYKDALDKYSYQLSYSETYSPMFPAQVSPTLAQTTEEKTVYLTFDDGPSPRTGEILDILKAEDVKATFFVIKTKEEYIPYMERAACEGHTIAVHSASHKYKEIYNSVQDYLADFTACYDYIHQHTGTSPTIFRFPGGSVNNYNTSTRKAIVEEMTRRGFVYFDWNVESGDSGKLSSDAIYNNVIKGCKGRQRAVIIFHDAVNKQSTVGALQKIIQRLKEDGWIFKPLTNEVKPMIFKMK